MPLIGVRRGLILPKKSLILPTFSYQGNVAGSVATNVVTFTNVPIGSVPASGKRFVCFSLIYVSMPTGVPSFTVNGGTAGFTYTRLGNQSSNWALDILYGELDTGTTATVVATFVGTVFGGCNCQGYTCDLTALRSQTPTTAFNNVSTGTSMTTTVNIGSNGSAVIANFSAFAITNGSQNFAAPNDPNVAKDATSAAVMWGHANNASAKTGASVSASWTTNTTTAGIGLAVFR